MVRRTYCCVGIREPHSRLSLHVIIHDGSTCISLLDVAQIVLPRFNAPKAAVRSYLVVDFRGSAASPVATSIMGSNIKVV